MSPRPEAQDPHVRLGVPRGAGEVEIKRAYRALAREYHPDLNPDPAAAESFHRITEAYELLLSAAADPTGRNARAVSDETVMVLLAEARVGSVGEYFSAVVEVTAPDPAGKGRKTKERTVPAAPGLLCLGESGVAFVYQMEHEQLVRRPDEAVVPIPYRGITSITIDNPEPVASVGTLTTSGGWRLVIHTTRKNLAALRTARVRYQADHADLPEAPEVSLWTKVRTFRWRKD